MPTQGILSYQAHVSLLDVQLELQGMLQAVDWPPSASTGASIVPCRPISHISGQTPQLTCTWRKSLAICASACKFLM